MCINQAFETIWSFLKDLLLKQVPLSLKQLLDFVTCNVNDFKQINISYLRLFLDTSFSLSATMGKRKFCMFTSSFDQRKHEDNVLYIFISKCL